MKVFIVLVALLVSAKASSDQELWAQFKTTHGKVYGRALEESVRFSIFSQNLRKIEHHNAKFEAGETTWQMGVTQFADLTEDEFISTLTLNATLLDELDRDNVEVFSEPSVAVPDSIDWRTKGAVTGVKNQGSCGGCWTFSATGTLEGLHFVKTGTLLSLSEQNLLDCATSSYSGSGCAGGVVQYAFNYIRDYGIELESSYPYTAVQGTCAYSASKRVLTVKGYVDVARQDENALKSAVGTIAPISVALNANEFQLYSSGIYDSSTCPTSVNHGVLAVGYGSENGVNYWIIKNSWGTSFGENGYIRMIMGKNICNLTAQPCYPSV